jgi:hypothetical protein
MEATLKNLFLVSLKPVLQFFCYVLTFLLGLDLEWSDRDHEVIRQNLPNLFEISFVVSLFQSRYSESQEHIQDSPSTASA